MVSVMNLIKCMVIFTLFLCCQVHTATINDNNNGMDDVDIGDILRELFPNQDDQFYHQQLRRASLRYHPHVLYKKASLKPILGHHGKVTFSKRDDD